jgi:hypothetical protein
MASVCGLTRQLLLVHIVVSVGLLGVDLALLILGAGGLSGRDPVLIYPAAYLLASRLLLPLAALSLATGVLLARRARVFRRGWVAAKFVITSVMTTAATLILVPGLQAAAAAASSGETLSRALALRFAVVPAVAAALLVLNAALGIYSAMRACS